MTQHYPQRCIDQGFDTYELTETHTDIMIGSEREKELNTTAGYPWNDGQYYYLMVERGTLNKGTPKSDTSKMKEYHQNRPKEHADKIQASKIGVPLSKELKQNISKGIAKNPKILCTHCEESYDPRNYSRWHGDNCKQKKG